MTGGVLPTAAVSRVFQSPQCECSLAAASSLLQFHSASQEPAFRSHCFSLSFLNGIFFLLLFNWKKQKLQSQNAGRRHVQPCVPASRRRSPPLPLCAHQTQAKSADADAAQPIRTQTPPPVASPPKLHPPTPLLAAALLGPPS